MNRSIILIAILLLSSCQPNNFDYKDHGANWGKQYTECDSTNENNNQQSPIQITDDVIHSGQSFLFSNFYPADATISFFNTTTYLKATSLGQLYSKTVNGDIIVMKATQMRFRSHSEHKVNGKFYDLEMQIFFVQAYPTARNQRLGVALLFEVEDGKSSKILKTIKDAYPNNIKVKINLSQYLNNDKIFDFWYYLGSSTLPPCRNKGLQWIVSKQIFKMSQQERNFFWNLFNNEQMKGNYRNIQPLRGNTIEYYHYSSA